MGLFEAVELVEECTESLKSSGGEDGVSSIIVSERYKKRARFLKGRGMSNLCNLGATRCVFAGDAALTSVQTSIASDSRGG
jgi:hypothetical protein